MWLSDLSRPPCMPSLSITGTNLSSLQVILLPHHPETLKFKSRTRLKVEEMSQPVILHDLFAEHKNSFCASRLSDGGSTTHRAALFDSGSDAKDISEKPRQLSLFPSPCGYSKTYTLMAILGVVE